MSGTQNPVKESQQTSTLRADAAEFVPHFFQTNSTTTTDDPPVPRPAKKQWNRQRKKRQDRSGIEEATAEKEAATEPRRTKNHRRRRKGQRRNNNTHKGNKEDHHHQEETTTIPLHAADAFPTLSSSSTACLTTKPPRWVNDNDRSMNLRQVPLQEEEDVQKQEPDPNEANHTVWKQQGLVMLNRKETREPAEELLADEPPNFDCMEDEPPQPPTNKRKIPKLDMGKLRDRLWEQWDEHSRKQQFRTELTHKLAARYVPAEQFAKETSTTNLDNSTKSESENAETSTISSKDPAMDYSTSHLEHCIKDDAPMKLLEILTALKKRTPKQMVNPKILLLAASLGRAECLDLLLSHRDLISMSALTSTKDSEGNNLFHCACSSNDSSAHLLESLFDFVGTSTKSQHQLLSKLLLAKNFSSKQTPLHLACQTGNVEVVNVFLNTCSSALLFKLFASQDDLGQTPLLAAVAANASDVVLALLLWNNGANTHHHPTRTTSSKATSTIKSSSKLCPLAWAAGLGNTEMVCLLLEFSTSGSYDLTAALRSTVQGIAPVNCITTLLQAGANPFAVSSMNDGGEDSSTCIQLASGNLETLPILKTMATSGRKLLHQRQRTRRADPVLQQQPESFFASLEREENFEMESALGNALLEVLWNCCRLDSQDHLVIATELFHCGATLKLDCLSKLRRTMVGKDFVPTSLESLGPCVLPSAFVSSYRHPLDPNPVANSTQLDDTNRSEALFWSRQLLQMPWMVEQVQDSLNISSCSVLNELTGEEIADTLQPDVVLRTDAGEEFLVHSQILSAKCEKLGAAFRFRSNTDSDSKTVLQIQITMDSKLCKFFLQHIYHGSMSIGWTNDSGDDPSQNVSDLLELMLIGEEYICPSLIQECELRLLGAMIASSQLGECVCPSCCKSIRLSKDGGGLPVAECLVSIDRERTSVRFPANLALDALAVIDQVEAVAGLGYKFNVSKTKATYTRSDVAWKLLENGSSEGGDSTLAATALLKDGILSFMLENFVRIVETPSFEENMQQGDDPKESQALLLRYCLEALRESPLTRLSNRENISPTTATKNRSK